MAKRKYCINQADKEAINALAWCGTGHSHAEAFEAQQSFAEAWAPELNERLGIGPAKEGDDSGDGLTGEAKAETFSYRGMTTPAQYPGNTITDIFTVHVLGEGEQPIYGIENVPGEDSDYSAWAVANDGELPYRMTRMTSEQARMGLYANAASCLQDQLVATGGLLLNKMKNRFEAGFEKRMNDGGWHLILQAAVGRTDSAGSSIIVQNTSVNGRFTRALVVAMAKNMETLPTAGNTQSILKFRLTDLYVSPACIEDLMMWGATDTVDAIGDVKKNEAAQRGFDDVWVYNGVNIHKKAELGVSSAYQTYITSTLGCSLPASSAEFVIGLDQSKPDVFMMPVGMPVTIMAMADMNNKMQVGFQGYGKWGFVVTDNRNVLLGAV